MQSEYRRGPGEPETGGDLDNNRSWHPPLTVGPDRWRSPASLVLAGKRTVMIAVAISAAGLEILVRSTGARGTIGAQAPNEDVLLNRHELVDSMNQATTALLREKGFVSLVEVLMSMGKLTREDHDAWRMRRIPYLLCAIRLNLSQLAQPSAADSPAKCRQGPSQAEQDGLRLLGEGRQTAASI